MSGVRFCSSTEVKKRITVADEGNLSLEQGKPVPHSETSHLVVFVLTAHMSGGERQNTMRSDGGNPSMKVKMDIHFFGVQTPRDTGISANGKKHLHLWEHIPCVRVALKMGHFSLGELCQ